MAKPLLHLVFGGEVKDPRTFEFVDVGKLEIVGIYPDYDRAFKAWRGISQRHADHANVKYVIVHLHRLMDPEQDQST